MNLLTILLAALISSSAFAETFKGRSTWEKSNYSGGAIRFSALEQSGVKFSAFMDALAKCNQAGFRDCVYMNVNVVSGCGTSYHTGECSAEALVYAEK